MLRGTDVSGTTGERSDNTVFGSYISAEGVLGIEIGVGGFPIKEKNTKNSRYTKTGELSCCFLVEHPLLTL